MYLTKTFFSALSVFTIALFLGLPSCTSPTSSTSSSTSNSIATPISECDCSKLVADTVQYPYPFVDPKIAKCRLDAYNHYSEAFKRISDTLKNNVKADYNLVNYNSGAFSIPIGNLSKIEPVVGKGRVWAMMALEPVIISGTPHQMIRVYLATENKGAPVFYHITSRDSLDKIPLSTAKANIDAFAALTNKLDGTQNHKTFYPKGFLFPRQDIDDIYKFRKKGSFLYGLLAIAPSNNTAIPDSVHMFLYASVAKENAPAFYTKLLNGKVSAIYGGGDTFLDFSAPCPTACLQGFN